MARRSIITCALLAATSALIGSSKASGQIAPGVFADDNQPSGAPDPTKLHTVWQVDPITGALSVRISFPTTPQGGRGPTIPFSLLYNSSSTLTLQTVGTAVQGGSNPSMQCNDDPFSPSGCNFPSNENDPQVPSTPEILQTLRWTGTPLGNTGGPSGPWTTSGPYFNSISTDMPAQQWQVNDISTPQYPGCTLLGPYLYTDESGATHDLNLQNAQNTTSGMVQPCTTAQSNSQAINPIVGTSSLGEGFLSQTTDGSALLTGPNGLIYPDGTKVTLDGTMKDSNGNEATLRVGSITTAIDSLGRTAFSTNIPVNTPGQLPTGASFYVSTTSETGLAQSYPITIGTAPFGTVNMPYPAGGSANDISNNDYCAYACPTAHTVLPVTPGSTIPVITSIGLPNTTSYTFSYDPTYATISKITFPTGGYVRFAWGIRSDGGGYGGYLYRSTLVVTDAYLSTGSGPEMHWSYSFPPYSPSTGLTSTITAPDGSYTVNTGVGGFLYSALFQEGAAPSWKLGTSIQYGSNGAKLRSTYTSYEMSDTGPANGLPAQIVTTLFDGASPVQTQVQYSYDNYANVTAKYESDYYPCSTVTPCSPSPFPWLRETFTNYYYQNNPAWSSTSQGPYLSSYIVDKPWQVLVTDGSGHPYSLVVYGYDETPVSGSTAYTQHDDVNYAVNSTLPRGNLTSEKRCTMFSSSATFNSSTALNAPGACISSPSAPSAWVTTTHKYDLTGQLIQTTDPNLNTIVYSYTDNYAACTPPGPTDGYVTSIQWPTGLTSTAAYSYCSGQVAWMKDPNLQQSQLQTTYTYSDPGNMSRLSSVSYPDGGGVGFSYDDTLPPSLTVTTTTNEASGPVVHTTEYDGLGRVAHSLLTSDPYGTDTVDTTYDSLGRVQSVTNPYRSTSDPWYGITSYLYDGLGRKTTQCQPDNSTTQTTTCVPNTSYQSWTYSLNSLVFRDENGNQWEQWTNGLGQMFKVLEPNGGSQIPSMETDYTFDPLGDLWSVSQCGGTCPSSNSRSRSFVYNGASWLVSALNPESGTTTYSYDGDGNVSSKLDGRGITTNYRYDGLNHLLSKSYQDDPASTPMTCFQYGGASNSTYYQAGRLISTWTQSSSGPSCQSSAPASGFITMRTFQYDPMGRSNYVQQKQCAGSTCSAPSTYSLSLAYDGAGDVTQLTNSVGLQGNALTLWYKADAAGRPCLTTSTWNGNFPANLFQTNPASGSNAGYASVGIQNWYLGSTFSSASTDCTNAPSSPIDTTEQYDVRTRVKSISASGQIP